MSGSPLPATLLPLIAILIYPYPSLCSLSLSLRSLLLLPLTHHLLCLQSLSLYVSSFLTLATSFSYEICHSLELAVISYIVRCISFHPLCLHSPTRLLPSCAAFHNCRISLIFSSYFLLHSVILFNIFFGLIQM